MPSVPLTSLPPSSSSSFVVVCRCCLSLLAFVATSYGGPTSTREIPPGEQRPKATATQRSRFLGRSATTTARVEEGSSGCAGLREREREFALRTEAAGLLLQRRYAPLRLRLEKDFVSFLPPSASACKSFFFSLVVRLVLLFFLEGLNRDSRRWWMTPRRGTEDLFAERVTKDWNIAFKSVYRSSSCLLFLISKLTAFCFGSQEFDRIVVAAGGDERERDL
jgi:hypothetical protein